MAVGTIAGALGAAANIGNGQSGQSSGSSQSTNDATSAGGSSGSSWESGYNVADSWMKADSNSVADSWNYGYSDAENQSANQAYGFNSVYGAEASARSLEYAREANKLQQEMWQKQANYNAEQAAIDREFQKEMSNTAYQRAVKDLFAAGLNPILAVGNMGASTPVGAMATSGLANMNMAQSFADQRGENSSWGKSYGWSKSRSAGGSHAESHSRERAGSHSEGGYSGGSKNSSWNKSVEHGQSTSQNQSSNTNNLKSLLSGLAGLIGGGSAKDNANRDKRPHIVKTP